MSTRENRLKFEKSPYLLQHKDNPVHWQAWGEEAFRAAREENKPIFLSIGYSTCHWCHVMEHESFEAPEVAEVLNRDFIPIKVDREERPDVDDIYMSALHAMRQRGGWPLSMFLTPELKPFYGGTYWPKPLFLNVLGQVAKVWREAPGQVFETGDSIVDYLKLQKSAQAEGVGLSEDVFGAFFRQSLMSFDPAWGGFGQAPKFPHANQLSMLLRIWRRGGDPHALEMVKFTLDKMARGGIYDHLGYGFARYSTDARWLIPHFEKMLYDNAQLAVAYLEGFRATQEPMFRRVAQETLDYVLRVMTDPEGGFYSAEDADSEGEEGKFYVWTFEELSEVLTRDELDHFCRVYQVAPGGNFEHGTNNLSLAAEFGWAEKDHPLLRSASEKLFQIREARVHPHKDDKILTAWNGLMVRALAMGWQVLGDRRYLDAAHRAAAFLKTKLAPQGDLLARYRDGEGRFAARLDDYAYLIQGLIELYQCDFRPEILSWALDLQRRQDAKFWDAAGGAYFFTDGSDASLLVRGKEGSDGALPNANAVAAANLLRLHDLTLDAAYREKALKTLEVFAPTAAEFPSAFGTLLLAYDYLTDLSSELAVLEGKAGEGAGFFAKLRGGFFPNHVVASAVESADFPPLLQHRKAQGGKTTYYLCRDHACRAPTQDGEEILAQLSECARYDLAGPSD
ncbi:MAG: thioredoxin domain-containing protein [Deltaproteobacteria bacterium]|nr:thioredoxin domain-containing protein [Deltaproteobacteria bacterium]